jgi:probable HAF family extracellular repeat protein
MHLIQRLSVVLTASAAVVAAVVPSAATAAAVTAAAPPVDTGQLILLESLGGEGSFATNMNERGDIVGASVDAADNYRAVVWWHGQRSPTALGIDGARPAAINENGHVVGTVDGGLFLWRAGSVTYLKRPAVASFEPPSINDRGQVASTATDRNGGSRAVLWQRGHMTVLPTPDGMDSTAVGINNRGQVIGTLTRPDASAEQAVLWQHGRMTRLGTLGGDGSTPVAINDRGQVSGNSTVAGSPEEHPFLWQRGRMTDLLAGTNATAGRMAALNETGMMTGTAHFGNHDSRPVLWRAGRMTDIGLPGHVGIGSHINARGDVSGYTWADPNERAVPFRWRNGHTTLFPEPVGDIATTVVGIDRHGHIGVDQETSPFGNLVLRST